APPRAGGMSGRGVSGPACGRDDRLSHRGARHLDGGGALVDERGVTSGVGPGEGVHGLDVGHSVVPGDGDGPVFAVHGLSPGVWLSGVVGWGPGCLLHPGPSWMGSAQDAYGVARGVELDEAFFVGPAPVWSEVAIV